MEYTDRKKVYVQAIEQWGTEAQLVIALEELNECGKDICKVLMPRLICRKLKARLINLAASRN